MEGYLSKVALFILFVGKLFAKSAVLRIAGFGPQGFLKVAELYKKDLSRKIYGAFKLQKSTRKVKMKFSTESSSAQVKTDGQIFSIRSLLSYLKQVKDTRKQRGIRYSLETILAVMVLAKLCGEDTPYAIADSTNAK